MVVKNNTIIYPEVHKKDIFTIFSILFSEHSLLTMNKLAFLLSLFFFSTTLLGQQQKFRKYFFSNERNVDAPNFVQATDLDNDGDIDIVGCSESGDIYVFEAKTVWNYTLKDTILDYRSRSDLWPAPRAYALDIDNDGFKDLVKTNDSGAIIWYHNNHDNTFLKKQVINKPFQTLRAFAPLLNIADIDNDGKQDIVVGFQAEDSPEKITIAWFKNETAGTFSEARIIAQYDYNHEDRESTGELLFIEVFDVNGDGLVDLLYSNNGQIIFQENTENQNFIGHGMTESAFVHTIHAADMKNDNDGHLDLVVSTSTNVFIYENDGSEQFLRKSLSGDRMKRFNAGQPTAIADLNGDGLLDIVRLEPPSQSFRFKVKYFKNEGDNRFTKYDVGSPEWFIYNVFTVDLDKNGKVDVIAPFQTGGISLYQNLGPIDYKIYVSNYEENSVSVIDLETKEIEGLISIGSQPRGLVSINDGDLVYAACYNANIVSVIDTKSKKELMKIPNLKYDPDGIAVEPDGKYAYVTHYTARNPSTPTRTVQVINTQTHQLEAILDLPEGYVPSGIAFSYEGTAMITIKDYAIKGNRSDSNIVLTFEHSDVLAVIENKQGNIAHVQYNASEPTVQMREITVGQKPTAIISPEDNAFAYVTNRSSGTISIINTRSLERLILTGDSTTDHGDITVGADLGGIAVDSKNGIVYVAQRGEENGQDDFIKTFQLDLDNNTVTQTESITVGDTPQGVTISPDGKFVCVANQNSNSVSIIQTSTKEVVKTIDLGPNKKPRDIIIVPVSAE